MSSPVPEMCLPVEGTRTQCRNSFLNKFTIIRPPNQWIATRTGRRKVMLLPKGWKLTEVSLLVLITTSLFEFRPWVHQVSWCWWWIVDTHSFIDLVRDSIFEEFFSFKHKLWFVIWMIKFHMFVHWIVFSSPICASIMLFLTAVQASASPSVVVWFQFLTRSL